MIQVQIGQGFTNAASHYCDTVLLLLRYFASMALL